MPNASALVTFAAPGASPTTTQYVFFETDPGEVPPRATIAASADFAGVALDRAGDDDGPAGSRVRLDRRRHPAPPA